MKQYHNLLPMNVYNSMKRRHRPNIEMALWYLLTGLRPITAQISAYHEISNLINAPLPQQLREGIKSFIKTAFSRLKHDVGDERNLSLLVQFNCVILFMQSQSRFSNAYRLRACKKEDLWIPFLEDTVFILNSIPFILQELLNLEDPDHDPKKTLALFREDANIKKLLWLERLCIALRIEPLKGIHVKDSLEFLSEVGGHPISHTACMVGSTLADPFYCYSAALSVLESPTMQEETRDATTLRHILPRDKLLLYRAALMAVGALTGAFWRRALMFPIEHPLSFSTDFIQKAADFEKSKQEKVKITASSNK